MPKDQVPMREVYLLDLLTERVSGSARRSLAITHFPHLIGRHPDCDSRFVAPWVSRRHCRFFLVGDELWLEDLGSRNGTILNGEMLRCPRPVHDGDRFELVGMAFQVRLRGSAAGRKMMPKKLEDVQHAAQNKQGHRQLSALIGKQVLDALGQPGGLLKTQVRPLWQGHFRVNVLTGVDAASAKVAHSYFLVVDSDGTIIASTPKITRQY
jgi:hypothetical protein